MKTNVLSELISKYSIGGNVDSVKIVIKDKKAAVSLVTADKTLFGMVEVPGFDIDDAVLPIYQTALLTKILKVFGSDINMNIFKIDATSKYVDISDATMEARFVFADESIIPSTPKMKNTPEYQVTIPITPDLISRINTAGNALDVNHITFQTKDTTGVNVIICYSANNTTRIQFKETKNVDIKSDLDFVSFNLSYIKEILASNSNMKNGAIKISNSGLMHIALNDSDKASEYFLVKVNHH